jgi:hypothetical protein
MLQSILDGIYRQFSRAPGWRAVGELSNAAACGNRARPSQLDRFRDPRGRGLSRTRELAACNQ